MMETRPMRKSGREITDPAGIEDVLRAAQVMRLGLTDGQWPYVVPLDFGYEPGAVYFHCAREGHKLDLLRANPRVCFEVEDPGGAAIAATAPCDWSASFRSVMGWGRADILETAAEKAHGLETIMRHHGFQGPCDFPENILALTCVVRITIARMTAKQHHWKGSE
jgi:uncharacterized protein